MQIFSVPTVELLVHVYRVPVHLCTYGTQTYKWTVKIKFSGMEYRLICLTKLVIILNSGVDLEEISRINVTVVVFK